MLKNLKSGYHTDPLNVCIALESNLICLKPTNFKSGYHTDPLNICIALESNLICLKQTSYTWPTNCVKEWSFFSIFLEFRVAANLFGDRCSFSSQEKPSIYIHALPH
jgi:hypothetical protein